MAKLIVIVNKLNKRSAPVTDFKDKSTIVGSVLRDYTFESVDEITNSLGKWHVDRDGHYYWGEGVRVRSAPLPGNKLVNSINTLPGQAMKDWGFIDFKIEELWKSSKGENVSVAILDSGLNYDLPDFKSKTNITYYNAFKNSIAKDDCMDKDNLYHGTDCAGIICAQGINYYGVAPAITLNVINIASNDGSNTYDLFIKGLTKAIELGSNVISISYSMRKTETNTAQIENLHMLIKKAYSSNIIIVASAGNSGGLPYSTNNYPASFEECLSIGGIYKNKNRGANSTKSDYLNLMGPGEQVLSLVHPSTLNNGTSFSTPFVAGVIALLISIAKKYNKTPTSEILFKELRLNAENDFPSYKPIDHGWGIINPIKTIESLLNQTI